MLWNTYKTPDNQCQFADADYQDFLAELEKDPYSLPGAKFHGEGEGVAAEGEVPASNADGKRVSALMQYLEQKWAGKLDGGSENRKTSRQVAFPSAIPPVFSMQSWNIMVCGLNCMQNLGDMIWDPIFHGSRPHSSFKFRGGTYSPFKSFMSAKGLPVFEP